jgi:hypothetical protein
MPQEQGISSCEQHCEGAITHIFLVKQPSLAFVSSCFAITLLFLFGKKHLFCETTHSHQK